MSTTTTCLPAASACSPPAPVTPLAGNSWSHLPPPVASAAVVSALITASPVGLFILQPSNLSSSTAPRSRTCRRQYRSLKRGEDKVFGKSNAAASYPEANQPVSPEDLDEGAPLLRPRRHEETVRVAAQSAEATALPASLADLSHEDAIGSEHLQERY